MSAETTSAAALALRDVAAHTRVRRDGGIVQGGLEVARPDDAPDSWATAALTRLLYRRCYLGRAGDDLQAEAADTRPAFAREDAALGAALRASDGGRGVWQSGWRPVGATPEGGMLLESGQGLRIHATTAEFRIGSSGAAEVRFPTARPYASPGFFLVGGTAGPAGGHDIIRWYLNLRPQSAPDTLRTIVQDLDRIGIPYTFKVLSDPDSYPRPDAGVLYVARDHLAAALRTVLGLAAGDPGRFLTRVPLFSLRVRDGVGVAEDPPQATAPVSFGQHRCRLVADGIVGAGPGADAGARFEAVAAVFAAAGVDIHAPHLNPGSAPLDVAPLDVPGGGGELWAA